MPTTWSLWCTSTNTTTVGDTVWGNWNIRFDTGTSATTTNATIWATWTNGQTNVQVMRIPAPAPETAEQRAARVERERQAQERYVELERQRAEARVRARKLLVEHLSKQQHEQLEKQGHFDVEVKGRTYRIRPGKGHGAWVDRIEKDKAVEGFCIYAAQDEGVLPAEDHALAHKLLLEVDEDEFRRRANIHRYGN